jgi:hypothetical protein
VRVAREGATSRNRGRRGGLPLPAAKVLAGEHGNNPRGHGLSHYRGEERERSGELHTGVGSIVEGSETVQHTRRRLGCGGEPTAMS